MVRKLAVLALVVVAPWFSACSSTGGGAPEEGVRNDAPPAVVSESPQVPESGSCTPYAQSPSLAELKQANAEGVLRRLEATSETSSDDVDIELLVEQADRFWDTPNSFSGIKPVDVFANAPVNAAVNLTEWVCAPEQAELRDALGGLRGELTSEEAAAYTVDSTQFFVNALVICAQWGPGSNVPPNRDVGGNDEFGLKALELVCPG